MRPDDLSDVGPIGDALVLTLCAGVSLRVWESCGILDREWSVYRRLSRGYGRMLVISEGGEEEHALARTLTAGCPVEVVANGEGLERSTMVARACARCIETLASARTVVVKTDQMWGGSAAVTIATTLRRHGARVGLVARGGYPWSRFVAWEAGARSQRAAEAASEEGELCRAADVVVGTTDRMLDDLRWRHGLDEQRTLLVPNFIPESARGEPASRREPGLVLTAGRLVAQKRVHVLIDALAENPGARLVVVGEGELEGALRRHAEARGVRAEFLPRLPQAKLHELMRGCWVYAQTSAFEGHPKTVLEAMACGAAVVVSDTPGLGEVIDGGVTGLTARDGALAGALARVLRDGDLAGSLGRGAAADAERFRPARVWPLEEHAHREALRRAGEGSAPPAGVVRWGAELLEIDEASAAAAWARSLHGYARRLPPERRARFCASVETPIYDVIDRAAIETAGGEHPKHHLMRYHDFFVERIREGERVLDLGCGYAAVARSIARRARAHVTGADNSDANLAQARAMVEHEGLGASIRLVRADITRERVARDDGTSDFDVVVLSNVLEHLPDRAALLARYVEWYRPRAILIRVPAFDRSWQTAWKAELGVDWRCDQTHETEYTEAGLRAELRGAGLRARELVARWGEYWAYTEPAPARRTPEYVDGASKASYAARTFALSGRVLDVGCGRAHLRECLPPGSSYVGVDFKPPCDVSVDLGAGVLPFADRSFDHAVCLDVLEHLEHPHRVLDELCRVSASGVLIALPNPARDFVTGLYAGSRGRLKYYSLPAEHPGNRHRWFFGFEEAEAFVRARARANNFEIERLHSTHDGCCYWLNGAGENVLDSPNLTRGMLWAMLRRAG